MVKETRSKILLSLILLPKTNFGPLNFDDRVKKIFDISFNQKTRGAISGLIKELLIEKLTNDQKSDEVTYRLTEKGYLAICLEFPFFRFLKQEWDKRWRIISYEIPEEKREIRDRLRRQMQGWGLGPWHRSFWLTPHPIIDNLRDLVVGREEEKYIQAFEADYVFGNKEILIEKVWQKNKLDNDYRQLFKKWHGVLSGQEEKLIKLKKVIDFYIDLLKIDPGLPKELVGEKWIGFESYNIYQEIKSIMLA